MKKVCTKCNIEKLLEEFPKSKRRKDGRASWCLKCNSDWKKENKDSINITRRKYAKANSEKISQYNKNWKQENSEHIKDYNSAYREENIEYLSWLKKNNYYDKQEEILNKRKQSRLDDPEKYRERDKKHDAGRKDKRKEYSKEWTKRPSSRVVRVNNQNKRRAKYKETDITTEWLTELRVLAVYCPTCDCKMVEDGLAQNGKTLDHIITLNTFGTHTMDNVRYICRKCNNSRPKDNSDVEESFITEFRFRHNVEEQ